MGKCKSSVQKSFSRFRNLHVSLLQTTTIQVNTLCKQTISNVGTALSLASSIDWDDREVVHMTRTEVVRSEGVVCLSDIDTVSTEDGCWVVLICHIVDEDRVPDIRINTSQIQREWCSPGDGD